MRQLGLKMVVRLILAALLLALMGTACIEVQPLDEPDNQTSEVIINSQNGPNSNTIETYPANIKQKASITEAPLKVERGHGVIVLDPGHRGGESGAVYRNNAGTAELYEKDINLQIAYRLRILLEADGYRVVLTRESDTGVVETSTLEGITGYSRIRADLQARVDIANQIKADLFISIHNNGGNSTETRGTLTYYSLSRPFGDKNLILAELVQEGILNQLNDIGYQPIDLGIHDDANFRVFRGRAYNLFVLGPEDSERRHNRATQMPGILGESLFLTNHQEAALLSSDEGMEALARGYHDGIVAYFRVLAAP